MHRALVTRGLLVEAFPAVFRGKNQTKLPLAIGISDEIKKRLPDLPTKHLREALADYVNGPRYLLEMKPGASRFDLEGAVSGTVTEQEASHAEKQLTALNRIWEERKNGARKKAKSRGEPREQRQQEETEAGVRLTDKQAAAAMDGGHRGL